MQLQRIHLVIGEHLDQLTQVVDGDVLAPDVQHEATQRILRDVGRAALGELTLSILLRELQQRTRRPVGALRGAGTDGRLLTDIQLVALLSEGAIAAEGKDDVPSLCSSRDELQALAKHLLVVGGERLGSRAERLGLRGEDDTSRGGELTLAPLPAGELGDDEGLGILCQGLQRQECRRCKQT